MVYLFYLPNETLFFVYFELRFSAYIALMFTTRTNALTCLLHNLKKVEMKYTLEVAYKQSVFVFRKIILFKGKIVEKISE